MWITHKLLYSVDYKTLDMEWVDNPTKDDIAFYICKEEQKPVNNPLFKRC